MSIGIGIGLSIGGVRLGGAGQTYILDVQVPDEATRTEIVNDERFPSWDWAEIPPQQM